MKNYQKISHFVDISVISKKNNLACNLIKMKKKFANEYDFFPNSWTFP